MTGLMEQSREIRGVVERIYSNGARERSAVLGDASLRSIQRLEVKPRHLSIHFVMKYFSRFACGIGLLASVAFAASAPPFQISGIYPHLAVFNNERECGTGA